MKIFVIIFTVVCVVAMIAGGSLVESGGGDGGIPIVIIAVIYAVTIAAVIIGRILYRKYKNRKEFDDMRRKREEEERQGVLAGERAAQARCDWEEYREELHEALKTVFPAEAVDSWKTWDDFKAAKYSYDTEICPRCGCPLALDYTYSEEGLKDSCMTYKFYNFFRCRECRYKLPKTVSYERTDRDGFDPNVKVTGEELLWPLVCDDDEVKRKLVMSYGSEKILDILNA